MDDMSNLEAQPVEQECEGHPAESEIQILTPRDVPLGGPRAMRVRRTLPTTRAFADRGMVFCRSLRSG